jgi:hypothetical protein
MSHVDGYIFPCYKCKSPELVFSIGLLSEGFLAHLLMLSASGSADHHDRRQPEEADV